MLQYLDFEGLQSCNSTLVDHICKNVKPSEPVDGIIDVSAANVFYLKCTSPSSSGISIVGRTKYEMSSIWLSILVLEQPSWPSSVKFKEENLALECGRCGVKLTTFDYGASWLGEVVSSSSIPNSWSTVSSNGIVDLSASNAWTIDGASGTAVSIANSNGKECFWLKTTNGSNSIQWPQNLVWDDGELTWTIDKSLAIFFFYTLDGGTTWHARLAKHNILNWTFTVDTGKGKNTTTRAEIPFSLQDSPSVEMDVDWGDGTVEHIGIDSDNRNAPYHTYNSKGTYQITVSCEKFDEIYIVIPSYDSTYQRTLTSVDTPLPRLSGTELVDSYYRYINEYYPNRFDYVFDRCENLTSIADYIFSYNPDLISCRDAFNGCKSIQAIPEHTFKNNSKLLDVEYCFYNTAIASIPENLFSDCVELEDVSCCFESCKSLASIPQNLFRYNTKLKTAIGAFEQTAITAIPVNLFRYNAELMDMSSCFQSCKSLIAIPADLFKYNTKLIMMRCCFSVCELLESIPENLFRYNIDLIDLSECFSYCELLTSIPENLFRYNTKLNSLERAFYYCTNLAAIPENLLRYNIKLTNLRECFKNTNVSGFEMLITSPDVDNVSGFVPTMNGVSRIVYVPSASTTYRSFSTVSSSLRLTLIQN